MSAAPEPDGQGGGPSPAGGTGKPAAQLAYLARALRAPVVAEVYERLAERAREEGWAYEEYLVAVLDRQVSARAANGTQLRINAAHFPARKSLDEYDYTHNVGLARETIAHLGTTSFIDAAENVILLGPPGTGKHTWRPGSASKPPMPGTGSSSIPPRGGSPGCSRPTPKAIWPRNWPGWPDTRY